VEVTRGYAELFSFNQVPMPPPVDPKVKPKEQWLMRDFVANHLYRKTESYFTQSAPVHYMQTPLDFRSMWGQSDYQSQLYDVYQDIDGFMTPVEIFKPYYAQAIAKYMIDVLKGRNQLDTFTASSPFVVTEIGGGNGSCAVGVLDFLRDNYPALYEHTRYEIIDVSRPFHERQRKVLAHHGSKVNLVNQNFFEYQGSSKAHGFFIGLEILDNLPHDKLVVDDQGVMREVWVQTKPEGPAMDPFTKQPLELPPLIEAKRTLAEPQILSYLNLMCNHYGLDPTFLTAPDPIDSTGERLIPPPQSFLLPHLVLWHLLRYPKLQSLAPPAESGATPNELSSPPHATQQPQNSVSTDLVDFLLRKRSASSWFSADHWRRELSHFGALTGGVSTNNIYFAPTCAMMFLHTIANRFPNRDLILNDFDRMVGGMHGINGPLVQRTEGNQTQSYSSYLYAPPGEVDIFYPTDFENLAVLQYELSDRVGYHCSSKHFMKYYADTKATRTRTLYNPLLNDFINTRFFLTARSPIMPDLPL
jgi:hypothetical protein